MQPRLVQSGKLRIEDPRCESVVDHNVADPYESMDILGESYQHVPHDRQRCEVDRLRGYLAQNCVRLVLRIIGADEINKRQTRRRG